MDNYFERQHAFGTIAMIHNSQKSSEDVYNCKSRGQIEEMMDVLKNVMEADSSYMQNEQALEAWMFINFRGLLIIPFFQETNEMNKM